MRTKARLGIISVGLAALALAGCGERREATAPEATVPKATVPLPTPAKVAETLRAAEQLLEAARATATEFDRKWAEWRELRTKALEEVNFEARDVPVETRRRIGELFREANAGEMEFVRRLTAETRARFAPGEERMREMMRFIAGRCRNDAERILNNEGVVLINHMLWYRLNAGMAFLAAGEEPKALAEVEEVARSPGSGERMARVMDHPEIRPLRRAAWRLKLECHRRRGAKLRAATTEEIIREKFGEAALAGPMIGELPLPESEVIVAVDSWFEGCGGGPFGNRSGGGRKKAAFSLGGSRASESAVDASLRWLAKHQEADGSWSIRRHGGSFPESGRPAVTGLALLAFLGAGHTETIGKYRQTVSKGVRYLITQQQANGAIGLSGRAPALSAAPLGAAFNHAIAGLALVEAYGMSRNSRTGAAAQKAVDYSTSIQDRKGGGWRYRPGGGGDLSVTSWFAMQLRSARAVGFEVPNGSFARAGSFLNSVTRKDLAAYRPGQQPTPLTAALGMHSRIFLVTPRSAAVVTAPAQLLQRNLPQWGRDVGGCRFYYWYFGTYSMFQFGIRTSEWQAWNGALRDMLIENQHRGDDADGSWDPVGARDGRRGGRAYTTAMGALCLEVYYRYLPVYKKK